MTKQPIKLREAKDRAQRIKQLIVGKLLQHIECDAVSIAQLAKLTKISRERISLLLNPSYTMIDLIVLCSVCAVLGLRIVINGTPIKGKL